MEKITIKQAIQRLNTSKATLYKYLKHCNIKPKKEKNRSYLSLKQLEQIRQAMKDQNPKNNASSKTDNTLKKQLEEQEKKLQEEQEKNKNLSLEKEQILYENTSLKNKNIEYRTRAEVLDEQNKKIIFQMGAIGERVATLEMEKKKLLEVKEEKEEEGGFFKRLFSFSKNN